MSDGAEDVAQNQLRSFVERIERLEEEKKDIGDDIKDVYAEAKGNGFDTKVLRKLIALRKLDANERAEQEAILDLYCQALGMSFQERLPFDGESIRTKEPRTTVQLCDGDGSPLHPPVDLETMKAAVKHVKRGRKPKDEDELLRDRRAEGPVFA